MGQAGKTALLIIATGMHDLRHVKRSRGQESWLSLPLLSESARVVPVLADGPRRIAIRVCWYRP